MPFPGRLNIILYQGDDFERDFVIEEMVGENQDPVDFTGHEIKAFIRTHQSSPTVIGTFDINWPTDGEDVEDRTRGEFIASISSSVTSKLPRKCVYDIQSTDNLTGRTKTWVYGNIRAIGQVTRD